jgi:predicted Rossmann fold nucleotide-binding protein DprA/Smf involved in DNA uptake
MPLCVFCAGTGLSMGHGTGWVPCPRKCPKPQAAGNGGCTPGMDPASLSSRVLAHLRRIAPTGRTRDQIAAELGESFDRVYSALGSLELAGRVRREWVDRRLFYSAAKNSA